MRKYRLWKGMQMGMLVVVGSIAFGFVLKVLWNWLMPGIFHLSSITFWQALGLLVLSKILFGGFHRHAGGGGGRRWRMEERWAGMTEEQRERFRAGMRGRGRWCESREQADSQQTAS